MAPDTAGFAAPELETMTEPATAELIVRAMISAAKADGEVSEDEIQRIVGRIGADGLSEEEKQFMIAELRRPLDLAALVAEVPNEMVAAGSMPPRCSRSNSTPRPRRPAPAPARPGTAPGRCDAVPPARDHRRHRGLERGIEPHRRTCWRGGATRLTRSRAGSPASA